jgi:hypothetical protein
VREYRASNGETRLWFDLAEIDELAEDALRIANLLPTLDSPAVDIETFADRRCDAHLEPDAELPPKFLGQTLFRKGLPPLIQINRDLTGVFSSVGDDEPLPVRWRSTVAHECGHVLLHRRLYEVDASQMDMFEAREPCGPVLLRCLKRDGGGDWREIQANRAMAALLMPKSLCRDFVQQRLREVNATLPLPADSQAGIRLTQRLSAAFQVSHQAASIRLSELSYLVLSSAKPLPEAVFPEEPA